MSSVRIPDISELDINSLKNGPASVQAPQVSTQSQPQPQNSTPGYSLNDMLATIKQQAASLPRNSTPNIPRETEAPQVAIQKSSSGMATIPGNQEGASLISPSLAMGLGIAALTFLAK